MRLLGTPLCDLVGSLIDPKLDGRYVQLLLDSQSERNFN